MVEGTGQGMRSVRVAVDRVSQAGDPACPRDLPRAAPRSISVILPTRNAADCLAGQLAALAGQTYRGDWELLVADNGSRDGTVELARAHAGPLPLRLVDASRRRGINPARNEAARHARGELLAFCDADDIVQPGWLAALSGAATRFHLIGGRIEEDSLNEAADAVAYRERLPSDRLPTALGFLPFAHGANFAVWADVLADLGGFDERFRHGNDEVELSFRAQLRGYRLGYAPDAVTAYRHRPTARGLFAQFRSYGRSEPLLFATYGTRGMPRPGLGEVVRRWGRIGLTVPLPRRADGRSRGRWCLEAGFSLGRLEGSLRHRVLYL